MPFNAALDHLTRTCIAVFGEEKGFWHDTGGRRRSVQAIFDRNYELVTVIGSAEVASYHPVLRIRSGDFPQGIFEDDRFVHRKSGEVFVVKEVRPDSGGGGLVILHAEQ